MRLDSAHSTPGGDGGFAINTWSLPLYQRDRHPGHIPFLLYFWPCWVFAAAWAFLELRRGRGGVGDSSLVAVVRFLITVASLVSEDGV